MSTKSCYLIECSDHQALQKKIKEIICQSGFEEEQTTYYDLEENTLDQVLEDLDTYSFLTPKKVVVISNALFLSTASNNIEEDKLNHLLKYLENPNPLVLFIMAVEKCDERKKIGKQIKKLVEFDTVKLDPEAIIEEEIADYKIEKEAKRLLLEYIDNDIGKAINECTKLKMYALDHKEITKSVVEEIVTKNIPNTDQLAFDFVKYIALRDKKRIFEYYEILKEYQFAPHSIIGLIESQIKLIYQVLLGKKKNMTKDEIAKYLKEHPYRIQKTLEFLPLYNEKELQEFIHKLHHLDYRIKSGQIDATIGFEIFLIAI